MLAQALRNGASAARIDGEVMAAGTAAAIGPLPGKRYRRCGRHHAGAPRAAVARDAERIPGIDVDKPFAEVHTRQRQAFWHGSSGRGGAFEGILPHCRRLFETGTRERVRRHLAPFMRQTPCAACQGARLRPQARAVRVNGRSIGDIAALSVEAAAGSVLQLVRGDRERAITATLLPEIMARLRCMQEVGLGYLTLDRRSDTLSGGEAQCIKLAYELNRSAQAHTLYIFRRAHHRPAPGGRRKAPARPAIPG